MISILIPIYNGFEFFHESLTSVIQQTYTDWELLVAVNGHPKNSSVFLEAQQMAEHYPERKVRVFDFHDIKGKSTTLNRMIEYCRGDYIAILDVDDIWENDKLAAQVPYMYTFDIIGTKCVYFGDMSGIIPSVPSGEITYYDFTRVNPMINSSALIRKELCQWEENGIEDYDLWLKLWKQHKRFYNIDDVLVKHRIHRTSAYNSQGNHLKVEDLLRKYV
jgi:glycosyltransferase involved in cell wall biosynthesis